MKGAVERVLAHCDAIGSNSIPITKDHTQHFINLASYLGNKGLRGLVVMVTTPVLYQVFFSVIAMATGDELNHLSFTGIMAMLDPPRPEVLDSITTLLSGGVSVKMITGDAKETAVAIGNHNVV